MAATKISDIIIPAIWLPYMQLRATELSALVRSGIVQRDPQFDQIVNRNEGEMADMPHWNDLSGESQVLDDNNPLSTKKITTGSDRCVIQTRGDAWSYNDLARFLAGSDPGRAIADFVAEYWVRDEQRVLLATLAGVFASGSMAGNRRAIYHTSGGAGAKTLANTFNARTFIDARQKLGDHKGMLTAVAVHSIVEAELEKQGLIEYLQEQGTGLPIATYQGHRVIVDDGMPVREVDGDTVYTSYLFGRGAIGQGVQTMDYVPDGAAPKSTWQVEFSRSALAHESTLINRRRYILHPRGVRWLDAAKALKTGPTNTELANGANWNLVFDPKDIRIVQFEHNI